MQSISAILLTLHSGPIWFLSEVSMRCLLILN